MTYQIPTDMFMLYLIKMDEELLSTLIDDDQIYAGMNSETFIHYLKQTFDKHRRLQDTSLLALPGHFDSGRKAGYGFSGNKSKEKSDLVIELNTEQKIVGFHVASDFVFDEYPFGQKPFK